MPHMESLAEAAPDHHFQNDAVRAIGCDGDSNVSSIVAALDWLAGNAEYPAIAVLSLGSSQIDHVLDAAVTAVIAQGIVTVIAGGNFNNGACHHHSSKQAPQSGTFWALLYIMWINELKPSCHAR